MTEITLTLKIFFYAIFGYYLFLWIEPRQRKLKGFYSLYYGLFSLVSIASDTNNVLFLVFTGIFWASIVKLFLDTVDENLSTRINPLWFGLLNLLNYFVLNRLIDFILTNSHLESKIFLFVFLSTIFLIDISLTLRKYVQ